MDPDFNRKSKAPQSSTSDSPTTQQIISDDQTPINKSPPHPSSLAHPSSTEPSSSTVNPEHVQEDAKTTLKLTHPDQPPVNHQETSTPSLPRDQLSLIPMAHQRPFFNTPLSDSRPHFGSKLLATTVEACSSGTVSSFEQKLAAQHWLMLPSERADFRMTGRMKSQWLEESPAGRTRPGPAPLQPGVTPYEIVQNALTELKAFIKSLVNPETSVPPQQPGITPTTSDHIHAASSSMSEVTLGSTGTKAKCSSSGMAMDVKKWLTLTVEDVIEMLDDYIERVPRTIGEHEMEKGLLEIQRQVGVEPRPSWYALMCNSYMDLWAALTEYFDCVALRKPAHLLENVEEGP